MSSVSDQNYHSFILRCWLGEGDRLRLRLVDIHRGTDHVVGDLSELPALLAQLLSRVAESTSPVSASPASSKGYPGEDAAQP